MTDKEELKRRLETSSSRVLLIGDIHLLDKPPRNCTDSYTDDILDILDYTARLETALNCDAVVWAGDVFHHKQPSRSSHRLVLRAIEAVKKYRRLLIVTGNHDISNDRLESVPEQQPLGVLFEAGAEELNGWDDKLPIFGVPWQQDWEAEGVVESSLTNWRDASKEKDLARSLVVTHAAIFPPGEAPDQWESIPPARFADAMGNEGGLYYGHIHEYHGTYEVDGATFCNPGAISRGSLTEYNMQRGVKAALWTPEHGFFELDLPHKPAEEVFTVEPALAVKTKKLDDERFLEEVGTTRIEISSTAGVITYIREMDVEEPVKRVAIEMLELQDV